MCSDIKLAYNSGDTEVAAVLGLYMTMLAVVIIQKVD